MDTSGDDYASSRPEDAFLIRLWSHLDRAAEISIAADVMTRLNELLGQCEAAAAEIRRWQSQQS